PAPAEGTRRAPLKPGGRNRAGARAELGLPRIVSPSLSHAPRESALLKTWAILAVSTITTPPRTTHASLKGMKLISMRPSPFGRWIGRPAPSDAYVPRLTRRGRSWAVTAGAGPSWRSISTRQVCALQLWLSLLVPISGVSALGLPCFSSGRFEPA